MSMMKKTPSIIYFHGYGSSPNTDKVKVLREHFSDVQSFSIDVDPDKSLPYLEEEIDHYITLSINDERPLVMIGTSLGAWYAGYFACLYYAPAILINPCYSFDAIKNDLGISSEIKNKYQWIGFKYPANTKFFIDPNDEVIDMGPFIKRLETAKIIYEPELVPGATHRFNGEPFNKVIEFLKSENF